MANPYLVSELLSALRDTGTLPSSDESSVTTKMMGFLNREQRLYLMRLLLSVDEAHQVTATTVALVTGQTEYRLPTRAAAGRLKMVELVDGAGGRRPLNRIKEEDAYAHTVHGGAGDYYLRGQALVLREALDAGAGSLRVSYYRRFNKLVTEEESGEISAIDTGAGEITIAGAMPEDFGTVRYDFIAGYPNFDILAADVEGEVTGAHTLEFDAAQLPDELAVGDFVALAGETPICNAPLELHDVLVLRATYKYLRSIGDARANEVKADLDESKADALALLAPRVESPSIRVMNFHAPGWNRVGRFRRRLR